MVEFILGLILGGVIGIFVIACLFIAKKSDNNAEIDILHQEIEGLRKIIDDYEDQKTQMHFMIEKLQIEILKQQEEIDSLIKELGEKS